MIPTPKKTIDVLMVGPFPKHDNFRGISSVLSNYFRFGDFGNYNIRYIATSRRGPFLQKLVGLCLGLLEYTPNLLKKKVKLVHIHAADYRSFYRKMLFGVLGKLFGKKVIVHIHGAMFKEFYSGNAPILRKLISKYLGWVDVVVVLSPSWQEYFHSISKNSRTRVLYNPVNGLDFDRISLRLGRKPTRILYLTMLYERKGIFVLLDAIPKILRSNPAAMFLLCGGGDIEKCEGICREKGIIDNVEFCGWVTGVAKIEKFEQADIFVLPSYHEGFPVSLIEAMFARLPIVCTPVGGIPDLLLETENALFVQPGSADELADKVIELLANESLRETMGKRNHSKAVDLFEVGAIIKRLCHLYDEVVAAP